MRRRKERFPMIRRISLVVFFVSMFVLASCGTPPEAYTPNMLAVAFSDGNATVYKGSNFEWVENVGLAQVYDNVPVEVLTFKANDVICLAVLNPDSGTTTGAPDCRTAELQSAEVGTPIVETPMEIFDAMSLDMVWSTDFTESASDAGFLAIFFDKDGNPIENESVRAKFLMLNRNNGMIITEKGILSDTPGYSTSVCVYLNDLVNEYGLRECMKLPNSK